MILAIDTSAAQCAVALLGAGGCRRAAEPMERGHAERLMPMIAEAMRDAGARWSDISAVAVCTGPGSFTGVRIGVAAARGIALGRGIPGIGVTRFEAVADGRAGVTVILDGRGGDGFAQAFGPDGEPLGAAAAGPVATLRASAATPVIGAGAEGLPDPGAIADIAARRIAAGGALPPPAPLYLRGADAAPSSVLPPVLLP